MNCACYEQVDNIFVEVSIELSFLKKRNSYSGTFDKYFPKVQSQRAAVLHLLWLDKRKT